MKRRDRFTFVALVAFALLIAYTTAQLFGIA